jgi:microcin C transport system substrate-binding protein
VNQRNNLIQANTILNNACYKIKHGKRYLPNGQRLVLSLMIKDEKLEKIALSLRENLKILGIPLIIRKFDANQYENKVLESDFDMIIHAWANSLSPGSEQTYFFGTKTADIKGSSNYIGLKDAVAEALATEVAKAKTWEQLKFRVHALDRYVMWLCLQIPLIYDNKTRFAYWKDRLQFPKLQPEKDMNVMVLGWSPQ